MKFISVFFLLGCIAIASAQTVPASAPDAQPEKAATYLNEHTPRRGFEVLAIHASELLRFHARKARLLRFTIPGDTPSPFFVPGFMSLSRELDSLFPASVDEQLPPYEQASNGVWRRKI